MKNSSKGQGRAPSRLMKEAPATVYNRLVVRYPVEDDRRFALFFEEAARRLASTFRGDPIDDTILMPYLMLYRQAFELQLKALIRRFAAIRRGDLGSTDPALLPAELDKKLKSFAFGHDLSALLGELLDHYDALDVGEPFPQSVKDLIETMHDDDPSGTAFRYSSSNPGPQQSSDFPDLHELISSQYALLVAAGDAVDEAYQNRG